MSSGSVDKTESRFSAGQKNLIADPGLKRGFWAIADQAIISTTSLLCAVVIGRFAGTEVLGQFTLGFSLAVIFSCLIRALVVGPFGVFVFRVPETERSLMRSAMWLQCGAIVLGILALGLFLCAAAWKTNWETHSWKFSEGATKLCLGVTFIVTGTMLREVARQASFAELHFVSAFAGDVGASFLTVVGIAWLWWTDNLQASSVFLVIGSANGIASLPWWIQIPKQNGIQVQDAWQRWETTWRFGRWEALGQTCQVLQNYALSWILAVSGGFAAAGLFAATWSIVQLASPFAQGAGNAMGPTLSRSYAQHGLSRFKQTTRRLTFNAALASAVYMTLIAFLGSAALHFFYDLKYSPPAGLMLSLAGSVAVAFVSMAMTKAIVILEQPNSVFAIQAGILVAIVLLSTILGSFLGIVGSAIGLLIAQSLGLLAKTVIYRLSCDRPLA